MELMDTFRSVHKTQQHQHHTKILITPVFLGVAQDCSEQFAVPAFEKYQVREPQQKNLVTSYKQAHGVNVALYLNPAEPLAGSLKACLLTINEGASKQKLAIVKPDEEGESDLAKVAEKL